MCHLTFRANYASFAKSTGIDVVKTPELLEEVFYAVLAGCHYWQYHNLNVFAEAGNYEMVTKIIAGSMQGQDSRVEWLEKAKRVFI